MTDLLNDRFKAVAQAKLAELTDIYRRFDAEPPPANAKDSGDRAMYQRQSAGKALLTHIVLLRKLLGLDTLPAAARSGTLDAAAYRAMVAALDEEVGEDG